MSDEKRDDLELEDNIELTNNDKVSDELADQLSEEELNDVSAGGKLALNCVKGTHIKQGQITV